jgi:hypothetical protein
MEKKADAPDGPEGVSVAAQFFIERDSRYHLDVSGTLRRVLMGAQPI